MPRHVWVNPSLFAQKQEKQNRANGIDLVVQLSSYDFPREILGTYDVHSGNLTIEFQYIDTEPPAPKTTKVHGLTFTEGKHSGKLLSIGIPVSDGKIAFVALTTTLKKAFESRRRNFSGMKTISKELNQNVAEAAILDEANLRELTADLAASS